MHLVMKVDCIINLLKVYHPKFTEQHLCNLISPTSLLSSFINTILIFLLFSLYISNLKLSIASNSRPVSNIFNFLSGFGRRQTKCKKEATNSLSLPSTSLFGAGTFLYGQNLLLWSEPSYMERTSL